MTTKDEILFNNLSSQTLGFLHGISIACLGEVAVTAMLTPELIDTGAGRRGFPTRLEFLTGLEVPAFGR